MSCFHCKTQTDDLSLMRVCNMCLTRSMSHEFFDPTTTKFDKLRNAIIPILKTQQEQIEIFLWLKHVLLDSDCMILYIIGPSNTGKTALTRFFRATFGSSICFRSTEDDNMGEDYTLMIFDNCNFDNVNNLRVPTRSSFIFAGSGNSLRQSDSVEEVSSYLMLFNEMSDSDYVHKVNLVDYATRCLFWDVIMTMI